MTRHFHTFIRYFATLTAIACTPLSYAKCNTDIVLPISIRVTADTGQLQRNESNSIGELSRRTLIREQELYRRMPELKKIAEQHGQDGSYLTFGITNIDPNLTVAFEMRQIDIDKDSSCYLLTKLDALFELVNPELSIASEVVREPCLYQEIATHELKHVTFNNNFLHSYYPKLMQWLHEFSMKYRVMEGKDSIKVRNIVNTAIQTEGQEFINTFHVDLVRQSMQKLDTPEENARLITACNSAAIRLIKGVVKR